MWKKLLGFGLVAMFLFAGVDALAEPTPLAPIDNRIRGSGGEALIYTGVCRPMYFMPPYSIDIELHTQNNTASVVMVGMDNTGQLYEPTKVIITSLVRVEFYSIVGYNPSAPPETIKVSPIYHAVFNHTSLMEYMLEGNETIEDKNGNPVELLRYVNRTWNSVRWYERESGLLVAIAEYYGMTGYILSTEEIDMEYMDLPSPPWMPGKGFNAELFDPFLWSRLWEVKSRLPNFTRPDGLGGRLIVNTTHNIAFDTGDGEVLHHIAKFIEARFHDEEDRLIAATLLLSDPGVMFSPVWRMSELDVQSFQGPETWVWAMANGDYPQGNKALNILRSGVGVCGAKSVVLSAILKAMGYRSGTLSMNAKAGGVGMGHTVAVVVINGQTYVLDPLYMEFFYRWDNGGMATYNDIIANPDLITRWGFVMDMGTPYEYTLDWLYMNSTKDDIMFFEDNGNGAEHSLLIDLAFFSLFGFFATLTLLAVNTGIIRRREVAVLKRMVLLLLLSMVGLGLMWWPDVAEVFEPVYITKGLAVLLGFITGLGAAALGVVMGLRAVRVVR